MELGESRIGGYILRDRLAADEVITKEIGGALRGVAQMRLEIKSGADLPAIAQIRGQGLDSPVILIAPQ